ncbi:thermonuclease family protein [Mycoplasmoides genitalium]
MKGFLKPNFSLGALFLTLSPIATACIAEKPVNNRFNFNSEQLARLRKARVNHWRDGDTLEVSFANNHQKPIRIYAIDTPEKAVLSIQRKSEIELKEANKSNWVCQKLIPIGSEVWIWPLNSYSYDREVAAVFFKTNPLQLHFESFAVEMVANGHALPIAGNDFDFVFSDLDPFNPLKIVGIELANGLNNAFNNRKNIFSYLENSFQSITMVYQQRGVDQSWTRYLAPSNDFSSTKLGLGLTIYELKLNNG